MVISAQDDYAAKPAPDDDWRHWLDIHRHQLARAERDPSVDGWAVVCTQLVGCVDQAERAIGRASSDDKGKL
jgi:hypothetical protein